MTSFVRAAGLGALTVLLMATAASAGEDGLRLRGSIDADYNNLSGDNDADGNLWNVNGNLLFNVSPHFNIQVGGGYHSLDGDVIGGDAWDLRGALFWRGMGGAAGVAIQHGNIDPDGATTDFDVTAYGVFGEWYAADRFTLAANGGWLDGDLSLDGHYYGGSAKFYIMPTLSLTGSAGRVHFDDLGHVTDLGVMVEWQVMADKPFTVYGGYTNSDFSGTDFNIDTFTIGLRWRFGDDGLSLVDGDRSNVVRTTGPNLGSAFSF
jgi:hypothetical protein